MSRVKTIEIKYTHISMHRIDLEVILTDLIPAKDQSIIKEMLDMASENCFQNKEKDREVSVIHYHNILNKWK
jgi:hypothetical protein